MQSKITLKIILISLVFTFACTNGEKQKEKTLETEKSATEKKKKPIARLLEPTEKTTFTLGEQVKFKIDVPDTIKIDSLKIYKDNQLTQILKTNIKEKAIQTSEFAVGGHNFRLEVFLNNGQKDVLYKRLTFKSNLVPEKLHCEIVKTYPHDPGAYTQGLFFENGYLYEGTGHRGESSLRKVKLENGELINSLALPTEYFGEGITAYKDKIIQLTWTSRTGFVYDKSKFKLLNKVRYPTEGWGLTTDGEKLIMSDGSSTIYFLDPEFFSELGRIEVYDHKGPIKNLNELEYINGKVYANVWQESFIVSFDPSTGKVLEKIDCSNLVPEKYQNHNDYVLNGIAYDSKNNRIFMTGKRWSALYQVKFKNDIK